MEFLSSQFDGECVNFRFRRTVLRDVLRLRSWNGLETFMERLGNVSGMIVLYSENVYEIEASILLELKDRDFKRARTDRDQYAPKRKIKKEIKKESKPTFDFESCYALYPRKEGKKKGIEKLKSQIKSQVQFELFLKAVKNYSQKIENEQTDKKYIKQFSSFVGSWEDYAEQDIEKKINKFTDIFIISEGEA